MNNSHFIIIIETTRGNKFGCYIESLINEENNYISDSNAFIFKFENDSIEKYPIIESKNAIKIFNNYDDNLFIIGYSWSLFGQDGGDIVIKKEEFKDKCICSQISFDFNGKENALIGRRGNFEVKRFGVWRTISEKDYKNKIEFESKNSLKNKQLFNEMKTNRSKDIEQLEEWTSLKCSEILFDSNVDDWSYETSILNERIIGKKQLTFIVEDEDGEIFGYYSNTRVVEDYSFPQITNYKSFQFNLQSQNNRLKQPMKFEIKDLKLGGIYLFEKSVPNLICLGNIYLYKENNKSFCHQNDLFEYHGIENALRGETPNKSGTANLFTPKRILVIQMK